MLSVSSRNSLSAGHNSIRVNSRDPVSLEEHVGPSLELS